MTLIDTHAHLYYDQFTPDFDEVIQRAKDADLKAIINIGADLESSNQAVKLGSNQIKFYSSIGIHPHEALNYAQPGQMSSDLPDSASLWQAGRGTNVHPDTAKLEEIFISNPGNVVAIGECGLDYHFTGDDYSPSSLSENQQKVLQKKLFIEQINLARHLNLPLIIHCRPSTHSTNAQGRTEQGRSATSLGLKDAWEDIFLPELAGTTGVFHSFTATEVEAKKALDLGYYLGFSCIVTYPKNGHLRQIIKWAPLGKILTETDCPYLPPQTQRGQRNEPANVAEIVKVIAEMKNLSLEETSQAVWQNAAQLFKFRV